MKYLLYLGVSLALMGATPAPTKPSIETVVFVDTTGTVAPQYWRGYTLTITKDLKTKYVTEGAYNSTVLETKTGKITKKQFQALVTALEKANYTKVKSKELNPPPVGGGDNTLTIKTDKGEFSFNGPSRSEFPPAIGKIFDERDQYQPK